jgi:hypothetical protein
MKTLVVVSALLLLFVGPSLLMAHGENSAIVELEEESRPRASTTPTPANPCDVPFLAVAAADLLTIANTECNKVPGFTVDQICGNAIKKATKECGDGCATHRKIGIAPPTQCPTGVTLTPAIVKRHKVGRDCLVICTEIPVPCACLDP